MEGKGGGVVILGGFGKAFVLVGVFFTRLRTLKRFLEYLVDMSLKKSRKGVGKGKQASIT